MDRPVGPGTATNLLVQSCRGNVDATEQLQTMLYEELRRLARGFMRRERRDHTLQPTQAGDLQKPPVTFEELVDRLARPVPDLVAAVREYLVPGDGV